jgi:hypothetical protein
LSFSQTGGARIGRSVFFAFNATWPFAKLKVDDTELALSCLTETWIFPKDSIRTLRKYRGVFFSTGLRIEHSVARYPPFVVFWTFGFAALKRELEGRGYTLSAD